MTQTFSKYQILGKLGDAGSHSTAFEAKQAGLDRSVELRILNRRVNEDEPAYQRFQREFRVLAQLDHAALISVLDLGVADGRVYYTTDFRESRSLRDLMEEQKGGLDIDQVLDWILPVGDALALLHGKGILHRDISLDSIRVDSKTGRAYLATFAVLKILKLPSLTEKGFKAPTAGAAYSPEMAEGQDEDERTDTWQLASVLYQCLTGKMLPSVTEVLSGKSPPRFEYEAPSDLRRGLADALDGTILDALAYAPEDRPKGMQHFLSALRRKRKLLEMKNVARSAGLKTAAIQTVDLEPEAAEGEEGAEGEGPKPKDTQELVKESGAEVVGEVVAIAKDWLEESPKNKYKAAGVLGLCVAMTMGVQWITSVPAYPEEVGGSNLSYRRRRRKPKTNKGSIQKKLKKAADDTLQEPTTPKTFEARWDILKSYVKSLPRDLRLKHFPPSVMANLRVGYYRSPDKASKDLDDLLNKALKVMPK